MNKTIKMIALLSAALTASVIHASEGDVKKALEKAMPSVKVDSVKPSEVKGLYEVIMGANIFYVSDDGKYLLQGRLVDVATRTDLTEQKLSGTRTMALEKMGADKMIIFKPKISKYKVSVFTDIDCGYCRKLHGEIGQYMAQGITVQYLFFPRAGKGSESYNKAISVWCAGDRNAALTAAKKDQTVASKTCKNPVDEHMQLAESFGVQGTPMIVSEKGTIFPGYVPAKQLAETLANENTSSQ